MADEERKAITLFVEWLQCGDYHPYLLCTTGDGPYDDNPSIDSTPEARAAVIAAFADFRTAHPVPPTPIGHGLLPR